MHFSVATCERKENLSFSQELSPRLWFDGELYRCIKQQGYREKQIDNDDDGQELMKIMRLRYITVLLSVLSGAHQMELPSPLIS